MFHLGTIDACRVEEGMSVVKGSEQEKTLCLGLNKKIWQEEKYLRVKPFHLAPRYYTLKGLGRRTTQGIRETLICPEGTSYGEE